MSQRSLLIDVSRLIWRLWRGGLPTGVDRVCLAYVEHFGDRSQAVIQWGGRQVVLSPGRSDQLLRAILSGPGRFRAAFATLMVAALATSRHRPPRSGMLYLNVGHTGLDDPHLARWIKEAGVRPIFLVHDLIPLTHPEYCRPGEASRHRSRMRNVLSTATGIIGNSQSTLDQLHRFADAEGLSMPSSVAAFIAGLPPVPDAKPKRFDRPHFVTIGTIEGRKNHLLLLHIWRQLVARKGQLAPLLVIVGQRGWEAGQTFAMLDRAADLRGHVLELRRCGDAELAGLILGSRALLMPSFVEGFGLPIVEAFRLGTPVIASDLPVFREFAGEIPTYLDPIDGIGWEQTISAFLKDPGEYERQRSALSEYRPPEWSDHFEVVERWLANIR